MICLSDLELWCKFGCERQRIGKDPLSRARCPVSGWILQTSPDSRRLRGEENRWHWEEGQEPQRRWCGQIGLQSSCHKHTVTLYYIISGTLLCRNTLNSVKMIVILWTRYRSDRPSPSSVLAFIYLYFNTFSEKTDFHNRLIYIFILQYLTEKVCNLEMDIHIHHNLSPRLPLSL